MKTTDQFKRTIQNYLEARAQEDELFAASYKKAGKNIDDCITYILNTVHKSGCSGFSDDEVYSMAIHYYDEDKIDVGKAKNMTVVVNHQVELTEEEKTEAKRAAIQQIQEEAYQAMKKKKAPKKAEVKTQVVQTSIF